MKLTRRDFIKSNAVAAAAAWEYLESERERFASGSLVEPGLDFLGGEDVEGLQFGEQDGVGDLFMPDEGRGVADFHGLALVARLARGEVRFGHDALGLLVEEGREQDEFPVRETQALPALGDTALADDDHLPPGAEGFADDIPFFEGRQHHGWRHCNGRPPAGPSRACFRLDPPSVIQQLDRFASLSGPPPTTHR